MYTIKDLKLKQEVEIIISIQGEAEIKYDGMKLRYIREGEGIKTILMGIVELERYLGIEKGDHYHRDIITLEIPEGIDAIGSIFTNNGGFTINIYGRLIDRVKLPKSCEKIYDYGFYGWYNLVEIKWGGIKKVGYRALLHSHISQLDIPFNISTDSQVCSNDDMARRPGRKGYLEYCIYGKWEEQSIEGLKDLIDKRRKDNFLRINRIAYQMF